MNREQNPFACTDNGCVLKVPGIPGQGTNGGCRCLVDCKEPDTRLRVRNGIRWLAQQRADINDLEEAAQEYDQIRCLLDGQGLVEGAVLRPLAYRVLLLMTENVNLLVENEKLKAGSE